MAAPGKLARSILKTLHIPVSMVLIALPAAAIAQDRVLSIDEAYRLALANHERVAIAGEEIRQAEADLKKATSRILPNITAEAYYTKYTEAKGSGAFITQPGHATNAEVRITQPLYSGGRDRAARRQAKLQITSTRQGHEGTKEDVLRDTSSAYYGALKALKSVDIQKAALKRAEERLLVAQARLKVGEVTKSAVLRAEAERAGAEADLIRANNGLDNSIELLQRIIGIQERVAVVDPPAQPPVAASAEALVQQALKERTDYNQRTLEEQAANEGIEIAKASFKPSLRLEGLYFWREQDPEATFFLEESASATVRLTYPLFEGFLRKAELSEARSSFRQAELRRLGLRRDIEVQVREALNNVKAIEALTESFRRQLAFAEEDYKMVFEQFKFGVATTLDVIDAENTLVSAQSSMANAVYDLELAKIDLKYVTGALIEGTEE